MQRRLFSGVAAATALAASLMIGIIAEPAAADPLAADTASTQRTGVTPNSQLKGKPIYVDETKNKIVTTLRGVGKQVYECTAGKYVLREPVAGLFTLRAAPSGIHGKGPFWALFDGSKVTGSNPVPDTSLSGTSNIPWLLVIATPEGAGGVLSNVRLIQRIDTRGGVAPAACGPQTLSVDYSANYVFWAPK